MTEPRKEREVGVLFKLSWSEGNSIPSVGNKFRVILTKIQNRSPFLNSAGVSEVSIPLVGGANCRTNHGSVAPVILAEYC